MASMLPATLGDLAPDEATPADASPSSRWEHPPSFYCPISQQCMHDPVVLADGHSYERRHIERWLEHHGTSPVSRVVLPQKDVFPNHALRNAIEEYFQQVFSVHRRAIRQSIRGPDSSSGLKSNDSLLRTIDGLMQCSLLVNADLSIERVLRRIMDEAKTLVRTEAASVFLLDADKQELYSTINSTGKVIRIPITRGIAGHVASTGEPQVINDAYSDARFNKSVDIKTKFKTRNMMCVPLKVKKGDVIGVVQLINKSGPTAFSTETEDGFRSQDPSGDDFSMDDLQFLQVFASQAATAIANSCSEPEHTSKVGSPTVIIADMPDCGSKPGTFVGSTKATVAKSSDDCCTARDADKSERSSNPAQEVASQQTFGMPQPQLQSQQPPPTVSQPLTVTRLQEPQPRRPEASNQDSARARPPAERALPQQQTTSQTCASRRLVDEESGRAEIASPPTNSQASSSSSMSVVQHQRPRWHSIPVDDGEEPVVGSLCSIDSGHVAEAEPETTEDRPVKRKSGRTRQRVAKWWSKVRCRTPSPEAGMYGNYRHFVARGPLSATDANSSQNQWTGHSP